MKDYYKLLEVSPDSSQEQIKKKYHLFLHAWHPDKFPSPEMKTEVEEKIKELNEAFSVLGDTTKRIEYDKKRSLYQEIPLQNNAENSDSNHKDTDEKQQDPKSHVAINEVNDVKESNPQAPSNIAVNYKALTWYLAIAFGFSWVLFTLPLAFSGMGEQTVSMIRLLCWMIAMWGPGIAAIVTTLFVLKEPFGTLGLKRFGKFRYYLAAWFVPPVLAALAIPLSVLFRLAEYDPEMSLLKQMVAQMPANSGMTLEILLIVQLAQGLLLGPALNVFATMGEELGWRGFLLPKLLPLGQWKAILVSGVIWGVWHAPAILQGHNYPGHPITGVFMMILFCIALGAVMSWLYLATRSTWAPAFGHGAVNAWGGLPLIFLVAGYNPLWGGTIASLAGVLVIALFVGLLAATKQLPVRQE